MKVSDAMTPNVTSVAPKTPLAEASKRMRDLNVGALPVVDGHDLVGVVTDRDITIRAGALHWDFELKTVADVMSQPVVCCRDTDSLEDAVRRMEAAQIRRLPVLDESGALVGMLSLGDVALRVNHELSGEALAAISQHGQMATAS